jgi:ABC-type amino acid transport substrate-binding protein
MKYFIFLIIFVSYLFSSVIESNKSIFTNEELEWIKNNPIVKVGVDEDWPPFDYINNEKKHSGIASEYLNIISNKTGLKFDIYANSWSKVIDKIPEREVFLDFTTPYLSLDIVAVARKDLKLESLEEIKNYKIAVQNGDYMYATIKKRFPDAQYIFAESNSEALKLVSYGKADLYIDNLPTISYFM